MNTTSAFNTAGARPLQFPIPANVYAETVVSVKHYTDRLFRSASPGRSRCASAPASSS
jgi:hypothetical protein